jgi:competence protein ComEC
MSNNPQTLNPQTAVDQRGHVRSVIQHSLLNKLQPKEKTLANALFFGIRDAGWADVSNRFRHAGMSHILAISGLHIGLFLFVATRLCTGVGTRTTWNMVVVLLTVLLIISTIESRAPMVRSVVMATIIAFGKMVGLRCSSVGLLGMSAILFLVFKPKDAGTITFQLTFIVVASLCVLLPQIQWRILGPHNPNAPTRTLASRGLATVWLTGMCAWCVASPITAHLFGSLSPSGIVSSVPSIALLFTTIVLGVAKVALGWLSPAVEQLLVVVFTFSLHKLLSLAILCGKLPFAHIHPISFSWAQSTVVLMWVVLWSLLRKNRALLWVALPIVCCFVLVKTTTSSTVITTVHVGHGTCHIIQNSNHTTLIDAGSRGDLDIGSRVLVPKLRSLGVSTINTLIITHADLDHLAGIIDVMQSYPIQKIVIAPQTMEHTTPPLEAVLREALLHQIQIVCGVAGWVEHKESLCFSIISPTQTDEYYSSNASSIVLLLKTHGRSVLFTGDIDERGITKIMNSRLGTIDVVELPHHGQWSEEAQRCIHTMLPRVVIQSTNISRYKKDRWTIPRDTVRFVTAIDGDITTTISAEGVLTVTGSNHPATMAPCVFTNRVSPLSQQ